MNELTGLSALGLELPSPMYMVGSILFGLVGYVAFRRGRNAVRPKLIWVGVILMVYPYAVSQTWLLWVVGGVLSGWFYINWD